MAGSSAYLRTQLGEFLQDDEWKEVD